MTNEQQIRRLWERRITRNDIARLTASTLEQVDATIAKFKTERKRERAKEKRKPKMKHDWLPDDDEANVEGVWVPTPEDIQRGIASVRSEQFVFGRRLRSFC